MICSASKIPNKFSVHIVNKNDILDVKTWWKFLYKKSTFWLESQRSKKGKREPFNVSFYRQFEFNSDNRCVVIVGEYVNGLVKKTFKFGKENSLISLPSTKLYTKKCPIQKEKIEDIQKVLKYIPDKYSKFYKQLKKWQKKKWIIYKTYQNHS